MVSEDEQTVSKTTHRERFPSRALAMGVVVTLAFVTGEALLAWRSYQDLHDMVGNALTLRGLAGDIMRLDEVLTMSASMAAATGDLEWEQRYRTHEPQLAHALDQAGLLAPELNLSQASEAAAKANETLVDMENHIFELVIDERPETAAKVLSSDEYKKQKSIYAQNMARTVAELNLLATTKLSNQRMRLWWALGLSVAALLVLSSGWWRIAQSIRRYLAATEEAERELAQTNRRLENRVAERTAEVSEANVLLRHQISERAKVEFELLHAQRLESVARLATGLAHEIDPPLQSVGDSCHFALEAVHDLHALQVTYHQAVREFAAGKISLAALQARLRETEEAVDMAYLDEEVPKALDRALDDLARVGSTVAALKDFAQPGLKEQAPSDLNRAVVSTLAVARNEYKDVARVSMQLGELPPVTCRVDEINQALLYIIVNAAQAVGEMNRGTLHKGNITVRTWAEGPDAMISVGDDGPGIAAPVRERMFDPFFTTKPGGKNTGQGLAMARSILVEKHGGTLAVESEVGKGSVFTLRLPVEGIRGRAVHHSPLADDFIVTAPAGS
jgi:signal transduction histidine kinase